MVINNKIIAREFLILSSTVLVIPTCSLIIVVWNSMFGQIDIYYSNRASQVYRDNFQYEESYPRYNYGTDIFWNLVEGGYEVPSDIHVFIKSVNNADSMSLTNFYSTLLKEKYTTDSFQIFRKNFPNLSDLELRNTLYYDYNALLKKSNDYYSKKLSYEKAKEIIYYITIAYLLLIYPIRGFVMMLLWSFKTLKKD